MDTLTEPLVSYNRWKWWNERFVVIARGLEENYPDEERVWKDPQDLQTTILRQLVERNLMQVSPSHSVESQAGIAVTELFECIDGRDIADDVVRPGDRKILNRFLAAILLIEFMANETHRLWRFALRRFGFVSCFNGYYETVRTKLRNRVASDVKYARSSCKTSQASQFLEDLIITDARPVDEDLSECLNTLLEEAMDILPTLKGIKALVDYMNKIYLLTMRRIQTIGEMVTESDGAATSPGAQSPAESWSRLVPTLVTLLDQVVGVRRWEAQYEGLNASQMKLSITDMMISKQRNYFLWIYDQDVPWGFDVNYTGPSFMNLPRILAKLSQILKGKDDFEDARVHGSPPGNCKPWVDDEIHHDHETTQTTAEQKRVTTFIGTA